MGLEELIEQQYVEENTRGNESKTEEWDVVSNVKQMWEQVKRVMADKAGEVSQGVRRHFGLGIGT